MAIISECIDSIEVSVNSAVHVLFHCFSGSVQKNGWLLFVINAIGKCIDLGVDNVRELLFDRLRILGSEVESFDVKDDLASVKEERLVVVDNKFFFYRFDTERSGDHAQDKNNGSDKKREEKKIFFMEASFFARDGLNADPDNDPDIPALAYNWKKLEKLCTQGQGGRSGVYTESSVWIKSLGILQWEYTHIIRKKLGKEPFSQNLKKSLWVSPEPFLCCIIMFSKDFGLGFLQKFLKIAQIPGS